MTEKKKREHKKKERRKAHVVICILVSETFANEPERHVEGVERKKGRRWREGREEMEEVWKDVERNEGRRKKK